MDFQDTKTEVKKLDEIRTYEDLVFRQLGLVTYIGSQDRTNSGKVLLEDANGQTHVVVRTNYTDAYINAVQSLLDIVRDRMEDDIKEGMEEPRTLEQAKETIKRIMKHLHKSGIFGRTSLIVYFDWKVEREATKEYNKKNAESKNKTKEKGEPTN